MDISRFLDGEGRITALPKKRAVREAVLGYLAEKFDFDRDYREKEVNALIDQWHCFGDYFILRRELVEAGLIMRLRDGSKYWRPRPEASEGKPEGSD